MVEVDAILLASGQSRRLGSNKLLLPLGNSTVIGQLLSRFPYADFARVILVWNDPQVADIAKMFPVTLCHNTSPETGKSRTIQLGLTAGSSENGVMFAVADQPLLKPVTISRLAAEFRKNPNSIIHPEVNSRPANPVIFPADLRSELQKLTGDSGGRELIRRYPERVRAVSFTSDDEFSDIDTHDKYQRVEARWKLEN